jgi:aspartate/tyrosine/aromatic aminotransferase
MMHSSQAFAGLVPRKPDALLALIAQYRVDPRRDKIDAGVGVYRSEAGDTPVMRTLKDAEAALLDEQTGKSYLGAEGEQRFAQRIWHLVSGSETLGERCFGLQTPAVAGALRVGAELLARARARPDARVGIGLVPFIDLAYQGLDDGMEEDAQGARHMLAAVPDALLAYSCDKNFVLYRDRVGALFIQSEAEPSLKRVRTNALTIAPSLWSMPPDHGAAAAEPSGAGMAPYAASASTRCCRQLSTRRPIEPSCRTPRHRAGRIQTPSLKQPHSWSRPQHALSTAP